MWLYRGKLQRRAQLPEFVAKLNEQVQVDLNQELPIRTRATSCGRPIVFHRSSDKTRIG